MRKFTQEEISDIIVDYKNGMRPYLIAKKYNRDSSSIINKLKELGIYTNSNTRLSKEETAEIARLYEDGNIDKIFELHPSLSFQQLYSRMSKIGVKSGNKNWWTIEDENFIKDNYFSYSLSELEQLLDYRHSTSSIQSKAWRKFGYSTDDDWTGDELSLLLKYYSILPLDKVCEMIPTRSKNAIISKAQQYNIKTHFFLNTYWNEQDTQYLIDNYKSMTDKEIAEKLHKDVKSVAWRRQRCTLYRNAHNGRNYDDLNKFLRGRTTSWRSDTISKCGEMCIFTGSTNYEVHHIYPVNQIINDMFDNYDIEYKDNLQDYSDEELATIQKIFTDELYKHGLGVCIRPDIHSLFHSEYGKLDIGEKQWKQFCQDMKNGIYKDRLN